jgi:hypothetical protein
MSRRINACLQAVPCDDDLSIDDPLLDEDKLEDAEDEVIAEEEELDVVEAPWSAPATTAREFTQE